MAMDRRTQAQRDQDSRARQQAAGMRTRGLRDEYYGVLDDMERAKSSRLSGLEAEQAKEQDAYFGQVSRALSSKMGDTGFGGGNIMGATQAGKEAGESLVRMKREGREEKARLESDLLKTKKENLETKQAEGDVDTDYDSVIADGTKEMEKAISDTRGPWYEGGNDEEEAERRMRAALAGLRSKNKEAADYLEFYYLNPQGTGYKANHG